jgi:ABC-2 family transporter protein
VIWLSWRQFRLSAATAALALVAAAALLGATGPGLMDRVRGSSTVYDLLTPGDRTLFYAGVLALAVAPAVVGLFWGAPLVAREMETGTHRLVWTQTVTRHHWLLTRLGLVTASATVVVGVASALVTWWSGPLDGAVSSTHGSLPGRMTPVGFGMRGLVPVGLTVLALVLAVTVGAVLRRTLPAMAVSLGLIVAVQVAVPLWVRPHLLPPREVAITVTRGTLDGLMIGPDPTVPIITAHTGQRGDWILSNTTVDRSGRPAGTPAWFAGCVQTPEDGDGPRPAGQGALDSCLSRLAAQGYHQQVRYQPLERFWALQGVETGLYLAVAALLAGFCFWWVRRRLA